MSMSIPPPSFGSSEGVSSPKTDSVALPTNVKLPRDLSKALTEATNNGEVKWSGGRPEAKSRSAIPMCLQAQQLIAASESPLNGRVKYQDPPPPEKLASIRLEQ